MKLFKKSWWNYW